MKNLYLDKDTNDLVLENRNLRFTVDNVEWLSGRLQNELRTYIDEWYLDPSKGLPYYEEILTKNADLDVINSLFKAKIISIPGVKSIIETETLYNTTTRKYNFTFIVLTDNEETVEGSI